MFFDLVRKDFGLPLYLAEEVLKGISERSRQAYAHLALALLEVWKGEAGEVYENGHGPGLLFPNPAKTRPLTADEIERIPPWECCGLWTSPVGLLYHLWVTNYKPLKQTLDANERELFARMLATLILRARIPDDYFDVRKASDYLTIHALAKTKAARSSIRQVIANSANAKRLRKAKDATRDQLVASRARFLKKYGSARGWLKAAEIQFNLSRTQIARRLAKAS